MEQEIGIPSLINGITVTTIGSHAFSNCTSLTSVTIPNSVTTIEDDAFYNYESLAIICNNFKYDVYINKGIKYAVITKYNGVEQKIEIPSLINGITVTTIGSYAFGWCTSLRSVTIPNSVTTIESYAFSNCENLSFITIPNSVTTIGENAFSYCKNLSFITIPNSVTTIGSYAFSDCASLRKIYCEAESQPEGWNSNWNDGQPTNLKIMWGYVESGIYNNFKYDVYINKGIKYAVITKYNEVEQKIEIPSLINGLSVTTIGAGAFYNCYNLSFITIPNSVTTIGNNAFDGCTHLTSVTIPNSVTIIGSYAFRNCTSLTSVTIPNSVTTIGNNAFDGCTHLTSVTIPNSVTIIGSYAFRNCTSLTSVTIPNSVTTIESYAFKRCTSLTNVTIPSSVTTIGSDAFYNCGSLAIIYCEAESKPEGWDSNWLTGTNAKVEWGSKIGETLDI